jgi:hypothetical protein
VSYPDWDPTFAAPMRPTDPLMREEPADEPADEPEQDE